MNMLPAHFGLTLLLAATFHQDIFLVSGMHYKQSNPLDMAHDAGESIWRASKKVLWSSDHAAPAEGSLQDNNNDEDEDEAVEAVAKPSSSAVFWAATMSSVAIANDQLSKISAASAKEIGKLSAASAKGIGDIYVTVDPEVKRAAHWNMQNLETHGIMHNLHLKSQLYYPHMHVANHRIVGKSEGGKPAPDLSVAAFAGKESSTFEDDRVALTLVCFVLIVLSVFFNMRRGKGDQASATGHGQAQAKGELLSVWDGTIATFSSILGMGFLSLPYCMSLAGWIIAPLIVFFTCCGGYTAHLLVWVMRQEIVKANKQGKTPIPGWGFLLHAAYGAKAERLVNMFLVVELWGYVLSGIVATALNLNQLVDEISISSAICVTVLIQFVLSNMPGHTLTRINLVCNALFLVCCAMFIITGLMLPTKAPAEQFKYVKPEGLLAACGILVFSPCSHSMYPAIMQRMEKPEQYPTCLRRAYMMACVAYLGLAVPGYYLFGDAVQPSAVRNIGADLNLVALPNLGWMNTVAAFCMVMKMSGLQPLILSPLNSTIESMMQGWVPKSVSRTLVAPTVLTISAVVAMHFAHQMAALLNIVGSIFCMSIALVLPVLCYWKLNAITAVWQQVLFSFLVVMGGTFAFLGLLTALDS